MSALSNKIGIVRLNESDVLIVTQSDKYIQFRTVNYKTQKETGLFELFAQVYQFLSVNLEESKISMIIKEKSKKTQLFNYVIYNYKENRMIFKKEELGGFQRLENYFSISQDLKFMVNYNENLD